MYGEDWVYANSRLAGSIIRLQHSGEPVEVSSVEEGGLVQGVTLNSPANRKNVRCKLSDLNMTPVPLGYVNYNKNAFFVARKPKRNDWRQGMRYDNITAYGYEVRAIPMSYIRLTIINKYPTLQKAIGSTSSGVCHKMAWHRLWAIDQRGSVYYRGEETPVGSLVGGRIVLSKAYQYLKEALAEVT